jgi:hypothetical protein
MSEFDGEDYAKLGEHFPVQIVGETQAGLTCTWDFYVIDCPPEVALEYDTDNSAETIAQSDTATVYVTGGASPYQWAVSGTGYTLQDSETTVGQNTLISDGTSCGAAAITITDACEDEVTGYVRNTTGTWASKGATCGLVAGVGSWTIDCYEPLEYQWSYTGSAIVGYQKQWQTGRLNVNASGQSGKPTQGECEADRAAYNCGAYSSPCLPFASSWTLTKAESNCNQTPRWQGIYEECGGYWTTRPCTKSGSNWYFIRAGHIGDTIEYFEWECS